MENILKTKKMIGVTDNTKKTQIPENSAKNKTSSYFEQAEKLLSRGYSKAATAHILGISLELMDKWFGL